MYFSGSPMERSRLATPIVSAIFEDADMLCDQERLTGASPINHDKFSRPQKRRRRLQRQAVRNALVNTAHIKDSISFLPAGTSSLGGGTCLHDEQTHRSSLQCLEMKIDLIQATLSQFVFHCGSQQQQESDSCPVESVLAFLSPEAKEFVPTVCAHACTIRKDSQPGENEAASMSVSHVREIGIQVDTQELDTGDEAQSIIARRCSAQEVQTNMSLPALLTSSAKYYSPDDLQATIDSLVLPIARERDHAEGLLRSAGLDLDVTKCPESKLQRCIDDAEVCGRMKKFADEYERNNRGLMSLSAIFDQLVAAMTKLPPIISQVDGLQSVVASTATQIVRMQTLKQSACQAAVESDSDVEVEDQVVPSCDASYLSDPFRIQGINKRGMAQTKRKKKR